MVSRSRFDSPAPRSAAASPAAQKQPAAVYNGDETSTLPLSSLAILAATAVPVGYAALHTEGEKLLGDTPTSIALAVFFVIGVLIMRLDFIDAVEEETEEEGLESIHKLSLVPGWCWVILGCGVGLFLALSGSMHYELELTMEQFCMYATSLKEAILRDTPTWTALAAFLSFGAVVTRSDFKEAVQEEYAKQGTSAIEESDVVHSGRWPLFLGSGVALLLAITVAWWQGSAQYGCSAPLILQELQSYATDLKDTFSLKTALLLLGDTATWTALAVCLMLGAVVMRFDFVDAMKEEAEKEGWQFIDESSIFAGCWLILASGVALALAGAHRWQLAEYLPEEVGIFFVSAVVAIGLASTIATSPKSRIGRAFSPPMKGM